jgi:hypothetical protein
MTTDRSFRFRLQSRHSPPERTSGDLAVQWLNGEGRWEPQELHLTMPGFRIYLISLLLCQHFYLVANARERGIPLARVDGELTVCTGEDWRLRSVIGEFRLELDPASAAGGVPGVAAGDLRYLQERMKECPVSRNLPAEVEKITVVKPH